MKLQFSGALAITAIIAVACSTGGASPTPGTTAGASATPGVTGAPTGGTGITKVKIGVDLPLSGASVANGQPTLQGIELAVKEWNEAGHGYTVELNVQDDAVNGVYNPEQGASNANTLEIGRASCRERV